MKQTFFSIIFCVLTSIGFSQDCSDVNTKIDANFSYVNESEDLEMPLNKSWNVALENQKAVLVFLQNDSGQATAGIVKNKNRLKKGPKGKRWRDQSKRFTSDIYFSDPKQPYLLHHQ